MAPRSSEAGSSCSGPHTGKVDIRLPGKRNSNSHDTRPFHQIISMAKWIRTSRLSIKKSLCKGSPRGDALSGRLEGFRNPPSTSAPDRL